MDFKKVFTLFILVFIVMSGNVFAEVRVAELTFDQLLSNPKYIITYDVETEKIKSITKNSGYVYDGGYFFNSEFAEDFKDQFKTNPSDNIYILTSLVIEQSSQNILDDSSIKYSDGTIFNQNSKESSTIYIKNQLEVSNLKVEEKSNAVEPKKKETIPDQESSSAASETVGKVGDKYDETNSNSEESRILQKCSDNFCSEDEIKKIESYLKSNDENAEFFGYESKNDKLFINGNEVLGDNSVNSCLENINSCNIEKLGGIQSQFIDNGQDLSSQEYRQILDRINTIESNCGESCSSNEDLKNLKSLLLKTSSQTILGVATEEEIQKMNEQNCDSWTCWFITENKILNDFKLNLQNQINSIDDSDLVNYNQELDKIVIKELSLIFGEECLSLSECQTEYNLQCSGTFQDSKCQGADYAFNMREQNQYVEAGGVYSVLSLMNNLLDSSATQAAALFGFEANFENVPQFLRDPLPSQLCMGEIDGYLDSDQVTDGGITTYGCSDIYTDGYSYEDLDHVQEGSPNCLRVILDMRAQRTPVNPDATVDISYSLYLKGPANQNLTYMLAVSYKDNGVTKKVPLFEEPVMKGGLISISESVHLPLNTTDVNKIDDEPYSFHLGIIALREDRSIFISKVVPMPLIQVGDYYELTLYQTEQGEYVQGYNGDGVDPVNGVEPPLTSLDMAKMVFN